MKIKLILPILFLLFVTSCKKNDDPAPVSIQGKWTMTSARVKTTGSFSTDLTLNLSPESYIQFNSDGTGITSSGFSGQPMSTENFTYKLDGTKITTTNSDKEVSTLEIQTLTSNSLVLYEKQVSGGDVGETWLNCKK
ncbi:MAG: lipocalin family protein [Flectobacillus sp.]|uniref:lipocalin family protein n=1 Tax=Flectobacillus sp. TaxID=50419 RepID=UPI003B994EFF